MVIFSACFESHLQLTIVAMNQIAYGLGTANYKTGKGGFDKEIVKVTVQAIKAGYFHLDGAEGNTMKD